MGEETDLETSRLYAAERRAIRIASLDREPLALDQLEAFVDLAVSSYFWKKFAPDRLRPTLVLPDRERGSALSNWHTGQIVLPVWARTRHTLLHELAHQLNGEWCPATGARLTSHGPRFAYALLHLAGELLPAYAGPLTWAFGEAGISAKSIEVPVGEYGASVRGMTPGGTVVSATHRMAATEADLSVVWRSHGEMLGHLRGECRKKLKGIRAVLA